MQGEYLPLILNAHTVTHAAERVEIMRQQKVGLPFYKERLPLCELSAEHKTSVCLSPSVCMFLPLVNFNLKPKQ